MQGPKFCDTPPYNDEDLCHVLLKSFYYSRSFAPDKRFSMTSKCDLDIWPRDLIYVQNTASYGGEHLYKLY
jgi:hypothetical protein